MKRQIVLPKNKEDEIFPSLVEKEIETTGIINIYKEGDYVGHVVFYKGSWLLRTITDEASFDSLELLLIDYNNYTFKFIT